MLSVNLHFASAGDGGITDCMEKLVKWGPRVVVLGIAGLLYSRWGATKTLEAAGKTYPLPQQNSERQRAIDFAEFGKCTPGAEKVTSWSMSHQGWVTCHPDGKVTVRKTN